MPDYEDRVHFIINIVFIGMIAAIAFVALRVVVPVTLPFLIGLVIAFLLKPITRYITEKTPFRRRAVSLCVIALFYLAVTSILLSVCFVAFSQFGRLLGQLPELYAQGVEPLLNWLNRLVYNWLGSFTPAAAGSFGQFIDVALETLRSCVGRLSVSAAEGLTRAVRGLPMFLTTLIFTVISSIMISADYAAVTAFLLRQLPPKYRHMLLDAKDFMVGSLFRLIKAYVIIMAVTMVELAVGLWAVGVELYLAVAVLVAALDILPLIGTGGILIPWGLLELARGNYFMGGGLLVLFAIVAFVRNVIEPKIVGGQIGLHPIVTIAAMYLGLRAFGFLGLILAPLAALLVKYLNDTGKIRVYK